VTIPRYGTSNLNDATLHGHWTCEVQGAVIRLRSYHDHTVTVTERSEFPHDQYVVPGHGHRITFVINIASTIIAKSHNI
jgi:hypothetical protein